MACFAYFVCQYKSLIDSIDDVGLYHHLDVCRCIYKVGTFFLILLWYEDYGQRQKVVSHTSTSIDIYLFIQTFNSVYY